MFLAEASIQLVPDGTLLIHLLMVALMVVILNRTLLKPINRILEERDKNILGKVDDAKTLLKARDERLHQYEASLRDARTEGYHLLEKERSQALRLKDEKVRAFKENLNKKLAEDIASTHEQEKQVQQQLEGQAKEIAEIISSQILHR
jgi:F-type H+-transporting ATPase subunit b